MNTARRRLPAGRGKVVSVKPIARMVLEPTARRMSIDGSVLRLTTVEYEILSRLAEAAGSIIAREQLMIEVFERQFNPEDRSLDVHIHRLRKKLGPHGWLLVTVRGSGHMLRSADVPLRLEAEKPVDLHDQGLVQQAGRA